MSEERKMIAMSIMTSPEYFKICEGCDSILKYTVIMCKNCKSYRFNTNLDDIIEHAKILGNREQTTVTEEDLF
jgi:RNA polymerase subunit RPABC4/transcription elongation factor Spt4